jgi:hypothetical protein
MSSICTYLNGRSRKGDQLSARSICHKWQHKDSIIAMLTLKRTYSKVNTMEIKQGTCNALYFYSKVTTRHVFVRIQSYCKHTMVRDFMHLMGAYLKGVCISA